MKPESHSRLTWCLQKLAPIGAVSAVLVASFLVSPPGGTLASCAGPSLLAAPASPISGGYVVSGRYVLDERASASCTGGYGYAYGTGGPPLFRFWERDPGRSWSIVQDYSLTSTHSWDPTGLPDGVYHLEVDVRSQDEPTSIPYDVVANIIVVLQPVSACDDVSLSVSPSSPGATGGSVVMTGQSSRPALPTCSTPQYRFWVKDPGRGWTIVQNWTYGTVPCGATNCGFATHTWGPVGTYYAGVYGMEVDVRDGNDPAGIAYDVVANTTYTLGGCIGATLTAAPPSPSVLGAGAVTLTATATCPGTATYRFWIKDPGTSTHWSIVKDYSTSNTYTWAAANQRVGTSNIEVDVRDQGSLEVYEFATQGVTYTFT